MKMMNNYGYLYLGIDIGSVALSIALLNERKQIVHTAYVFHHGQIAEHLAKLLRGIAFLW